MNITLLSQMRVFLEKVCLPAASAAGFAALILAVSAQAAELPYSATPLFWSAGVKPNVALMIDTSGSMGGTDTGGTGNITSACNGATIAQPMTRMNAAKEAACQTVTDNASSMRIGLYRFTGGNNGLQVNPIANNTAATLKTSITGLSASGGTPLTSSLDVIVRDYVGVNSPIQYRCQKNYVVFFTDGAPTTGKDEDTPLAYPSIDTQKSSDWANSTAASNASTGSPGWDGFLDPQYNPDGSDVYPWLDDLAQFAYDIDIKTDDSPAPTTAICGFSVTGLAGKDCSNKSWQGTDDTAKNQKVFQTQNIVTYTLGFGANANNGLMRSTPLVNRVTLGLTNVNTTDDTIELASHGLEDGQFVHYYAVTNSANYSTTATGDTVADSLDSADTTNMANGALLSYNNAGGTSLEYVSTPAVPAITCASANATMGLTSGNTYYVARMDANTLRLANSAANADLCDNYADYNGNVATYCIDFTNRSINTLVHTFSRAAIPGTPGTPDTPAVPPAPVVPALDPTMTLASPYPISKIDPAIRVERIKIPAHGLTTGQRLVYNCETGGTVCSGSSNRRIGGLTPGNTYYAAVMSAGEFRLATSAAAADLCDNYPDGDAGVATNCIDISNPTSGSGTSRNHHFTAYTNGTPFIPGIPAVAPVPAVVASFTADGTGNSPVDMDALQESFNFPADHNLSTQDLVTYTCSGGTPGSPAVTSTRSTYYATNVTSGNPGSFQLSLTSGGPAIDIAVAGNGSQTFSWTSTTTLATIGGLFPYETDARPDNTPNPSTESAAKGKYYVEYVNADKFKLRQCGTTTDCASEGAVVDLTSTGNGVLSTGPGSSYFAATAAELSAALASAFKSISANTLSFAAVERPSQLTAAGRVYQAKFSTRDWSGEVVAYNSDPITGKVILTPPAWLASQRAPAFPNRKVYTWNTATSAGVAVDTIANLTAAQRISMGPIPADQQKVLDWVLGKDDTTGLVGSRARKQSGALPGFSDINVYGDVIGGAPHYVGTPANNYDTSLPTGTPGKSTYLAYKGITRTPMLYVGANDGMLHALNAITGDEVMAFIPNSVFTDFVDVGDDVLSDDGEVTIRKFYELTRDNYGQVAAWPHRYFVDGGATSGDAFFTGAKAGIAANSWHTVLVGGLGKGGRGIYALDVTDPSSFGPGNILWEFSTTTGRMGYSYSKPVIVRLRTGEWAAIFGNGYDAAGDLGSLFIINLETGATIKRIDATGSKGMSTVSVLTDANGTATTVYAGDLGGNVWKFDLRDSNSGNWASTVTTPFFVALDSFGNPQPITSPIALAGISPSATCSPGANCAMLYFGSGSYFNDADKTYTPGTTIPRDDTFYALLDNGAGNIPSNKSTLVEQTMGTTMDAGTTYRTSSQNAVDYTGTTRGWYMNLRVGSTYQGERVVFKPAVAAGLVVFSTVVPAGDDPCASNATSWTMILNALDGNMRKVLLDTNKDGVVDSKDKSVSGYQNPNGLSTGVTVIVTTRVVTDPLTGISKTQTYLQITEGQSGDVVQGTEAGISETDAFVEETENDPLPGAYPGGRMSWRQLQ
jgi:Tfp pilus tip-associated adhesin PilY1